MSPLERKNDLRPINEDFRRLINASKDNTTAPKKVPIDFRNDIRANVVRPIYQIPIELVRFRKNNGRIASDVLTYESVHGEIDEALDAGQNIVRGFLDKKHGGDDNTLYSSLLQKGQREPAIITCDGFLINGNRRKMTMDKLNVAYPNDTRFSFLRAVILPGPGEAGGEPTYLEIEQVENRLQLMKTGKAEYKGFDHALSVRRKIDLGMTIEEQLRDNPEHYSKNRTQMNREIKKVENSFLNPLECIERYLLHFERPNAYNLITNRWQAFVDYSNFYNSVLKDDVKRAKFFDKKPILEEDIPTIEDIAFKIIRKGTFNKDIIRDKLHMIIRDLKNIIKNEDGRDQLFRIADEKQIPHDLNKEEIEELENPSSIRERDRSWQIGTDQVFTEIIKNAKAFTRQGASIDSPLVSIKAIKSKLDKIQFSEKLDIKTIKEFYKPFREAQDKLDELVDFLDKHRMEQKKNRLD